MGQYSRNHITITSNRSTPIEWDLFSASCGASYRSSYWSAFIPYDIKSIPSQIKRFEIFLESSAGFSKVAQCAILRSRHKGWFADRIQVLPEFGNLEKIILTEILKILGNGEYSYGSEWSFEDKPFLSELKSLSGVTILNAKTLYLEAIDFCDFPSWRDYWAALNRNVKRNYKRANSASVKQEVLEITGFKKMLYFPAAASLRTRTFKRKNLSFTVRSVARSLARVLFFFKVGKMKILKIDGKIVAYNYCIKHGHTTFYLEGGFDDNVKGCSWLLMIDSIEDAYIKTGGRGRFVMGPVDEDTMILPTWEGLARSRRECLAKMYPISTTAFRYDTKTLWAGPQADVGSTSMDYVAAG